MISVRDAVPYGMTFLSDEVISVVTGTTSTLTRSSIDNTGGSRATRAVIYNHTQGLTDGTVGLRFATAPDADTFEFRPLRTNQEIVVDGYENLLNLKMILLDDATAKLFVQYFN